MTPKGARAERAALAQRLAADFDIDRYTCAKAVYDYAKPLIAAAPEPLRWPQTSQFSLSHIASMVEREVYRRWLDERAVK